MPRTRKANKRSIFGTGWKGGSFRAAVGGYVRKKAKRARGRTKRYLKKNWRRCFVA